MAIRGRKNITAVTMICIRKKKKNMYRITCMRRIFDEMSIQVSILKK